MPWSMSGKHVLVTGASSGIGAAVAVGFARRGATVGICARRQDRLGEVFDRCREHAPDSRMWPLDVRRLDELASFAHRAVDELGGIDVLVNNAGIPKRRSVADLTDQEVDDVMAVNYHAPVRLIRALLPGLVERATVTGEPAKVVNVSSVAARLSPPGEAAYAASKAALSTFSECLAVELWDEPVDVHVVNPGLVATELHDLPGNDPLLADDIEVVPPEVVVDAMVVQLEDGPFEIWVPGWLGDVAAGKAADLDGFLAGSAQYRRDQAAKRAPQD